MRITDDRVLATLPPLYSQEEEEDPIITVKLTSDDDAWVGYLIEGERRENDFVVFGLFIGDGTAWGQIPVSRLAQGLEDEGLRVHTDRSFQPTRLSAATGLTRRRRATRRPVR